MTAIFDLESDGLYYDVTKVHCIAIKVDDNKTELYTDIPAALDVLSKADILVAHNGINYDLPVLEKLYGWTTTAVIHDTLLMSKLAYPNLMLADSNRKTIPGKLKGSHSLKAWGYRLQKLKGTFGEDNEWHTYTEAMGKYCILDVDVTHKLYERLLQKQIPAEAIRLESEFAKIISRQEKYGWYFDVKKAQQLHVKLLEESEAAEAKLFEVFKPLQDWIPLKEAAKFTKSGNINKNYQKQLDKGAHYNDDMEWGFFKEVVFNPGSRQHIARWLKEVYGWKPTQFTDKGGIIINDDILNELEFPEGKILAHYFNVRKVIGMVAEGNNAWLKMVKDDNRIHGSVDTLGAVSRRCTHNKPNVAQVPSSRAYMGKECRELFTVAPGKKLVGCDADGLELRTLSHYMARFDNGAYAKAVDEGDKDNGTDIHTLNQKAAGLPTRDNAKTFIYAFLYGAGDGKIGSITGGNAKTGKELKSKFFKQLPAIKKLVDAVQDVYKKTGTLKALDGNPYYIRSSHSALNTLLQGAGALVMKYYLVALDANLQKYKGKYEFVGNIHDEVQIECDEEIATDVAQIAMASFDDVTDKLQFRIPLRGSADIGNNWADTH